MGGFGWHTGAENSSCRKAYVLFPSPMIRAEISLANDQHTSDARNRAFPVPGVSDLLEVARDFATAIRANAFAIQTNVYGKV